MTKVAIRYAKALFLMCPTQSEKEALHNDLIQFRTWMFGSTELRSLINNPLVPKDAAQDIIGAILTKAQASDLLYKALMHIIESGRFSMIEDIAQAFRVLYQDASNIQEASVKSACALTAEEKQLFQDYLENRFSKTLVMTFTVDPSLMGGFQILVGSQLIDSSIKTKLFNLRQTLKGTS